MRRLGCAAALGVVAAVSLARGAERVPVMVRSAPGRFEVSAIDASAAHTVVRLGEEMWRLLSGPLNLPASFSSPIFVRVRPEKLPAPFGAAVEPGGVVSIWIQGADGGEIPPAPVLRRALARGLLLRLAVSIRGSQDAATVPGWLELGAAGWVETRVEPARLDALKQASQILQPPALSALLRRAVDVSGEPDRAEVAGAVWLFTFLQNETTAAAEWSACLAQILAGRAAGAALNEAFADRFGSERERELWWQTGWHQLTRAQTLPSLDASSSRASGQAQR